MTKPERMIADELELLEVKYEAQYRFDDCRNINPLPFDFYLPGLHGCIEYDGITHSKPIYGEAAYLARKRCDAIKTKYCHDNGIKLLRIPYTQKGSMDMMIYAYVADFIGDP